MPTDNNSILFISIKFLSQKHRHFVVGKLKIIFALSRHSGMFLAGIHPYQCPKTWIPAKNMLE
jgi:hypothetical protein